MSEDIQLSWTCSIFCSLEGDEEGGEEGDAEIEEDSNEAVEQEEEDDENEGIYHHANRYFYIFWNICLRSCLPLSLCHYKWFFVPLKLSYSWKTLSVNWHSTNPLIPSMSYIFGYPSSLTF